MLGNHNYYSYSKYNIYLRFSAATMMAYIFFFPQWHLPQKSVLIVL